MNSIKERVLFFINHKRLNNKQFEDICGLGNGFVSKIGYSIREPKVDLISKSFPDLNRDWLIRGVGNMLNAQPDTPIYNEVTPLNQNYIINVPLVNQYAQAGYMHGYQDAAYVTTLPTIPFIVDHEAKGNYVAFEVRGDSMNDGTEDSYLEGDRLLCREIYPQYWVESKLHIKKWDFVIVHEEGIIVKRIIDHNVENHTITIHSLNDMYPDRVIDLAEVKQIFNVIELQRPRRR